MTKRIGLTRWIVAVIVVGYASPAQAQSLDTLLARAAQRSTVPALSALIIHNGKVTAETARGLRSTDARDSVTPNDVWHIGSDGKAMTATMIARLVERGILSWDTPLAILLPELAAEMQPVYRGVTLRDLFSHQAGLQANVDTAALTAFRTDRRSLHEQRLAYARLALSQAPAYTPRTANLYSNSGPVIAATIAERATGLGYEQLMRQEVFTPLQMSTAAFGPTHRGQPLGHSGGKPETGPGADNAPVIAPAGEIHLSMDDWAKFAIDQMGGERGRGKLLRAETYKFLHTPGRTGSPFALGWSVSDSLAGIRGPFLEHAGSNTYWYAVIVLAPSTESGILVAANAGPDAGADKVEGELVKALLPSLVVAPH